MAWGKADDVVRNGGGEGDWLVRPGLKYEWVVDPSSCMAAVTEYTSNNARSYNSSSDSNSKDQSAFFQLAWEAVNPDSLIDRLAGTALLIGFASGTALLIGFASD